MIVFLSLHKLLVLILARIFGVTFSTFLLSLDHNIRVHTCSLLFGYTISDQDYNKNIKMVLKTSQQRNNPKLTALGIFYLTAFFVLFELDTCSCVPTKIPKLPKLDTIQEETSELETSLQTWKENIIVKLNWHVRNLEANLEHYMGARYLPILRIVSRSVDYNAELVDGGIDKYTKALLRLSTIHTYLIIHQTALTSAAVKVFESYLKSHFDDYELKEIELKSVLIFLNDQIRTHTLEDKSDYLVEFAFLCSKFQTPDIQSDKTQSTLKKLIEYLKAKVNLGRTKAQELKDCLLVSLDIISDELRQALDFKLNEAQIQGYVDDFFSSHGLESLISGYMYMSHNDNYMSEISRKFSFKKYFDSCMTGKEENSLKRINDDIVFFDPTLPLDIDTIKPFEPKEEWNPHAFEMAKLELKRRFHKELVKNALPLVERETNIFKSIMQNFNDPKLTKLLAEHDKNDAKGKDSRSSLLFGLSQVMTEYQMLKLSAIERYIRLAKFHLGYTNRMQRSNFVVPFNDIFFALIMQRILIVFYPLMTAQASAGTSDFGEFRFDLNRAFVDGVGKPIPKSSDLSQRLDKIYDWLQNFHKREEVTLNLNVYILKKELDRFRSLPLASQGYYVALNNYAIGQIFWLYMEPSYNKMSFCYDVVQKHIVESLLQDQQQKELAINGKTIESNTKRWMIITPQEALNQ